MSITLAVMDDPFRRRTATIGRVLPWLAELARTLPGLAESYTRRDVLDPRAREKVMLAVTEVNGCRYSAWIHGSWQDYLGEVPPGAAEDALLAYAVACAEAGRPLPTAPLAEVLPPNAVRAVRATVAQIELSNLVGNTVDGLLARLRWARPFQPAAVVQEVAAVAAALPAAVPMLAVGALLRSVGRLAPSLDRESVVKPDAGEANLLVHMAAEALPVMLANAGLRLALLNLPVRLPIAVRAGNSAATMRIGRGGVILENGVTRDAVGVVEADVDVLLRVATGALLTELAHLRVRPR